jgi:4a-hydroxytetrahydrobiopterin dehydratase
MNDKEKELADRHCEPCEGGTPPLSEKEITRLLSGLEGWEFQGGRIGKTFHFKNYYRTMAFVNATAWISHRENHHPDLEVGYNTCRVTYHTHAIEGLSENDFICAARVDALMREE